MKIILPTVVILVALAVTMTLYSSLSFIYFTGGLMNERVAITVNGLKNYLKAAEKNTRAAAVSVSAQTGVIEAVKGRRANDIIAALAPSAELYGVSYFLVTDSAGNVLARTHEPEHYGDKALGQNIKDALNGKVSTYYEEGILIKVTIHTASPVYDTEGGLIGAISAGIRLDSDEGADRLKKDFDADFSVFLGDTRVATTIIRDGGRINGTRLDPKIAKIVLEDKREYIGNIDLYGENVSAYYLPLINARGEAFAILATGKSNTGLVYETNSLIITGILIGTAALAFSVLLLLFITSKIIKPVKRLAYLVSEVSLGNVNIDPDRSYVPKDEIGALMTDIYSLIDIIKSMVNDLTRLTGGLNIYSDTDFRIDADKYSGSYKEIIVAIKSLTDSISMAHKTMAVMDLLDTMVSVTDLDYNLLYINRGMADTYGVDRLNCVGKKCYEAIRGLGRPCPICQMRKLLPDKGSCPSADYEYLLDEASGKWVGGRSSIIRWVDGGLAFFNSINDVTLKKKREEALNEAVEAANAASDAKTSFLANMSHELRSPLNVIIGLTDLKLDDGGLAGDVREVLQNVRNAGGSLLSIVNDILDISKVESGKLVLNEIDYCLASLLNDTITLVTTRIGEKPITFSLDAGENLPERLYGDDLRVKQILNNLLTNAIKYTNEGDIRLGVRCVRDGGGILLEFTVSDTGIGIREGDIEKLFIDYQQADTLANRKIEGTGLGLPIAKRLAEAMGGEISVTSEYGKGSTFRVRLRQGIAADKVISPEVVESLRHSRYNANKQKMAGKLTHADMSGAAVLVVDDNKINLAVASGLMKKYKMRVDCVTGGQEAIERIKAGDPVYNAIFMDHMMPGMDGIEAAEAIRALDTGYAREIPIIALTANAVTGTAEMFFKHGFQAFLSKPIDVLELDSVIRQWVANERG